MKARERRNKREGWTAAKVAYLFEHYQTGKVNEIAKKFGISPKAVRNKANSLGLVKQRGERMVWTPEQEAYIREHYPIENTQKIADALGVSPYFVRNKAGRLGLSKENGDEKKRWSDEEKEYLAKHYPLDDVKEIGTYLNRNVKSIYSMAKIMGLKRGKPESQPTEKKEPEKRVKDYGTANRIGTSKEPVTDATLTLVSGCYLSGDTVEEIAILTGRSMEQVEEILKICQQPGGRLERVKRKRELDLELRNECSTGRLCSRARNARVE